MDTNTPAPAEQDKDERDFESTGGDEPESGAGYGNHAGQPPVPDTSK